MSTSTNVQDDALRDYFGLHERQVRKILNDLEEEHLVCAAEVSQRIVPKKTRGELNADMVMAYLTDMNGGTATLDNSASGKKRGRSEYLDESEEDSDSDEEEDTAKGGMRASGKPHNGPHAARIRRANEAAKLKRQQDGTEEAEALKAKEAAMPKKIKAIVYYINPRYFVDVIKYRIFAFVKFLERLESSEGNESMFKCTHKLCRFQCNLMEAVQRKAFETVQLKAMRAKAGITTAPPDDGKFRCPVCNSPLAAKHVERIAATANKLVSRFKEQLKTLGITDILAKLEHQRLGENKPDELIRQGKISFLPADAQKQVDLQKSLLGDLETMTTTAAGATSLSTGSLGKGSRIFQQKDTEIAVSMEAPEEKAKRTQLPPGPVAVKSVVFDNLPEHLKQSSITGAQTKYMGFVPVSGQSTAAGSDATGSADGTSADVWFPATGTAVVTADKPVHNSATAAFNTDINADSNVAFGDGATEAAALSSEEMWQMLFSQLASATGESVETASQPAAKQAAVAAGGDDEDEWEDVG